MYLFDFDGIGVGFAIRSHLHMLASLASRLVQDFIGGQVSFALRQINNLGGDIALRDGLDHRHFDGAKGD